MPVSNATATRRGAGHRPRSTSEAAAYPNVWEECRGQLESANPVVAVCRYGAESSRVAAVEWDRGDPARSGVGVGVGELGFGEHRHLVGCGPTEHRVAAEDIGLRRVRHSTALPCGVHEGDLSRPPDTGATQHRQPPRRRHPRKIYRRADPLWEPGGYTDQRHSSLALPRGRFLDLECCVTGSGVSSPSRR
jgi:hypothetical protein